MLTNEARVLRVLRILNGLSMKEAGKRAGFSDSMIAHIETGRANPPTGERLERLLNAYGGIKTKSFYERVRRYQHEVSPKDELKQLVELMNDQQVKIILPMVKALLGDKSHPV